MPRLYVLTGPNVGRTFEVASGATLGRDAACDVHVRHPSVSRHHARIELEAGSWRIVDTGSRNGIKVGERRVESAPLEDGAVFSVGEIELRFRERIEAAADREAPAIPAAAVQPPPVPTSEDDEIRIEDPGEVLLEEAESIDLGETLLARPRPAQPPPRAPTASALGATPAPAARPLRPAPRAPEAASGFETRKTAEKEILQHHRIPDREGFFASDLAQQPAAVKLGVGVLVVLVFLGVLWAAFRGTALLRERARGPAVEAVEPER